MDVPIKDEYLPNVYLSVMLVRPRVDLPENADPKIRAEYIKNDLGMPRFKAGITKISVSNASKKARLVVTPNKEEYSPGDPVTITIQTQPGAEVALAVADRAVLDLVDYQYANPVNKLYQNWPLGVRILENRRFLIKQYRYTQKGESPGGQGKGDELEGLGGFDKDSEDGSRTDIRYTAYWNPAIIADKEGKATVTFTLPHNLTTFRIMALASSNGRYRNASREFRVRKALVIQKNLPRFIRPGDTLSLGAVVINQTDRSDDFVFSVQSPLLQGPVTTTTVTIGAGEAKEITFPVSLNIPGYLALKKTPKKDAADPAVKEPAGQVTVTGWLSVRPANIEKFTGAGFRKSDVVDRLAFTFPVREQPPEEAFTVAGFTTTEDKEFIQFPVPGRVLPGMGGLDITLAPTALVGLNKAFTFFKTNPFFCLEQRASAFLLTMSAGELLKQFSFRPPSDRDYDFSRIEELFLGEIGQFVNADGGFKTWKEDRNDTERPLPDRIRGLRAADGETERLQREIVGAGRRRRLPGKLRARAAAGRVPLHTGDLLPDQLRARGEGRLQLVAHGPASRQRAETLPPRESVPCAGDRDQEGHQRLPREQAHEADRREPQEPHEHHDPQGLVQGRGHWRLRPRLLLGRLDRRGHPPAHDGGRPRTTRSSRAWSSTSSRTRAARSGATATARARRLSRSGNTTGYTRRAPAAHRTGGR